MTDEAEFGPAMAALTEKQRSFVLAMVERPGITQTDAARVAGYSDVKDGAKVRGHYLAHNPNIQAAIREEAGKRLHASSLLAANVLVDILGDDGVPAKERLKAAGMLLDRTGFAAVQKIEVNKTDHSGKAIMERIRALSEKLGVDTGRLLGGPAAAPVVDAEFSEVKDG